MRPIAGMRVREELSHRGFPLVADGCLFSYHSHHSTPSLSSINLTRSSVTILLAQSAPIPRHAEQTGLGTLPISHLWIPTLPFLESRAVRGEISLTLREGIPHSRSRKLEVSLFGRLHLDPPRLKGTDEPGVR